MKDISKNSIPLGCLFIYFCVVDLPAHLRNEKLRRSAYTSHRIVGGLVTTPPFAIYNDSQSKQGVRNWIVCPKYTSS